MGIGDRVAKKYLDISIDMFPVKIIFCPNPEIHYNYLSRFHKWMTEDEKYFNTNAVTTVVNESGNLNLVVGLEDMEDIYLAKGLIVHELSHVVTQTFNHLGVNCDETRSYMLQRMYINVMTFYDKYLESK